MFESGLFFIDGGFRPAIVKKGWKWTHAMYLDGSTIRCKRILSSKVGRPRPFVGGVDYNTKSLAAKFLSKRNSLTNQPVNRTKKVTTMLKEATSCSG